MDRGHRAPGAVRARADRILPWMNRIIGACQVLLVGSSIVLILAGYRRWLEMYVGVVSGAGVVISLVCAGLPCGRRRLVA